MGRVEKTVFISYRRANVSWALAMFHELTHHGYDVFFDYTGIGAGDFESIILENINARAHFLVLLTPTALDRCEEPGDWLRREIETAISMQRNVVPIMLEDFTFAADAIAGKLTGNLAALKAYNGLRLHAEYFADGLRRLRETYLNKPLDAIVHPVSPIAKQAATDQQEAARVAPPVSLGSHEPNHPASHFQEQATKERPSPDLAASRIQEDKPKAPRILVASLLMLIGLVALVAIALKNQPAASTSTTSFEAKPAVAKPSPESISQASNSHTPPAVNPSSQSHNSPSDTEINKALSTATTYFDDGKYEQALPLFRRAAESGDGNAMTYLGWMYQDGRGVSKDDAQAVAWYRKAAKAGNIHAMFNLGWMYEKGRGGLPKDDVQAVSWYRKAADARDSQGMNNLGSMYANGRGGLPKDEAQAVNWYREGAEAGNAMGMTNLGWMYENGRGVPKDVAQAVSWYRKAAAAGDEDAKANLKRLGY